MATLDEASWAAFLHYQDALSKPPDSPLRFQVGDAVRAHVGPDQWCPAVVIGHWWRMPEWPPSFLAPYQLRLAEGELIFAAVDADSFIIAASGTPPAEIALEDDPVMALGWPERTERLELEQNGYTPLHACCLPGPADEATRALALRSLLRRPLMHPDHNKNRGAETPLHCAISYQRLECVKLLLAAGANPRAMNGKMQTALQLAEEAMATEATFPWCGPQDKAFILLLARRVDTELHLAEEVDEYDDDDDGWEDMDDDDEASKPTKTIRKGRLNKPRKAR